MALLSGQITVEAAGTAVQGPSAPGGQMFAFKGHPDNTGSVWVGNDGEGDVTNANGFPLAAGEIVIVDTFSLFGNANTGATASPLARFWFDADTNGDKVCWLRLE